MKRTARLTGAVAVAASALALAAASATAAPASAATTEISAGSHSTAAVFVQSDDPTGNTVVAYTRSAGGALTQAGVYPTGGLGGVLDGSVADHLASQGSLALDSAHGLLLAVNAGSDTITSFGVRGAALTRRQTVSSGGDFPVSIGVHGNLVYVLNARSGGSIQGYRLAGGTLVAIPGSNRALGLDPTQTPEFTHTPGQVGFTPNGSTLIVTTKANGNAIDAFAIDRSGRPSATPVVTTDAAAVPFGFTFDTRGHLVVTEAGPSAVATFDLYRNGTLTLVSRVATGQAATCWVVRTGSTLYASNAGSGTLSGLRVDGAGALTALGNTATDAGTVDAAATPDGRYLYVQTGIGGIVDEFRVLADGSLSALGSVTVPSAVGGQGIAAS